MYRPNFCSDCGKKVLRVHWHLWTSHRFCDECARRLWKERLKRPLIAAGLLFSIGLFAGNGLRSEPSPVIIHRAAASPSSDSSTESTAPLTVQVEEVFICGARTKKGTACSRRVHGNVRCFQHKGLPAMLPKEKLLVKG